MTETEPEPLMNTDFPMTRDLVLIGGGHTHALVLRKWGMKPLPGARLTLINPGPTAPYTGMLPGYVAGHYARDELEIDLVRLARFAGARLVFAKANGVDREKKRVLVEGHSAIAYDHLSIDVGITSTMPNLSGFSDFAYAAKPLDRFAKAWDAFLKQVEDVERAPDVAVIGGGVAGVELALAMHHRLQSMGLEPQVTVIDASTALEGVNPGARMKLFECLRAADIRVLENTKVEGVSDTGVHVSDGSIVNASFTVGAAGAKPHDWLTSLEIEHEDGFLSVNDQLRSITDSDIFAVGDCAHMVSSPRPKAGVFAVRQAPVLYRNLRADLTGRQRKAFKPQANYLKLISLGGKSALADKFGMAPQGPMMWLLKDRIDRAFMRKFVKLPEMPLPAIPRIRAKGSNELDLNQAMCGGCGAKVGATTLNSALQKLPAPHREDVMSMPGDDAAILAMESDWQTFTTDHLRSFTLDPVLQTKVAAIHAMGDVWAMGGQPQAAVANIVLPRMTPRMQSETLREIMDAAQTVFAAAGADIVGGHTSLGQEMMIGFSVTGLSEAYPLGLEGAQPGDALILTKPIGSGTILAAEMQGKADGVWVQQAYRVMEQPSDKASHILGKAQATAMTDVTGFGLAGHLMNICKASQVAAHLKLSDIPFLKGSVALAKSGLHSTLYAENKRAITAISAPENTSSALLFDPQTAGGLLASVPSKFAKAVVRDLNASGYLAAQIGTITAGDPFITAD